jgi:hypothetical protein
MHFIVDRLLGIIILPVQSLIKSLGFLVFVLGSVFIWGGAAVLAMVGVRNIGPMLVPSLLTLIKKLSASVVTALAVIILTPFELLGAAVFGLCHGFSQRGKNEHLSFLEYWLSSFLGYWLGLLLGYSAVENARPSMSEDEELAAAMQNSLVEQNQHQPIDKNDLKIDPPAAVSADSMLTTQQLDDIKKLVGRLEINRSHSLEIRALIDELKVLQFHCQRVTENLELIKESFDNKNTEPLTCELTDLEINNPVVLIKQYSKDGLWHIIPNSIWFSDEWMVEQLLRSPRHPTIRDEWKNPNPHRGSPTRYAWYPLTQELCSVPELDAMIVRMKELFEELSTMFPKQQESGPSYQGPQLFTAAAQAEASRPNSGCTNAMQH